MAKKGKKVERSGLPAEALPAAELIQVGARFRADKLIAFAHAALAKRDAYAGFARFGFDEAWASRLKAQLARVEAAPGALEPSRAAQLSSGERVLHATAAAKDWRRTAATVVSIVPAYAGRFPALQTGHSVPELIKSVRRLIPLVAAKAATGAGGGAALAQQGRTVLRELETAQAGHKTEAGKLSPELRDAQLHKGILYTELKRLGRAARAVCPADAHLFAGVGHIRPARGNGRPAGENTIPQVVAVSPAK
jgi:hypothetical protein